MTQPNPHAPPTRVEVEPNGSDLCAAMDWLESVNDRFKPSMDDVSRLESAFARHRLDTEARLSRRDDAEREGSVEGYCVGLWTEEKGEALQLIGKAMRFGIDTPGVKSLDGTVDMTKTPRSMLEVEMGDVRAAIEFAVAHGIVRRNEIDRNCERKLAKLLNPDAKDNLGRPLAPQPPSTPEPAAVARREEGDLREQVATIISRLVSSPSFYGDETLMASHRRDQLRAADMILAALAPAPTEQEAGK